MKIARNCVSCGSARLARSPAVLMPFIAARVFGWEPVDIEPDWGFRDLRAGQACSVCSSLLCEDCGMLFLDMRFDDEEMSALYSGYRGETYTALRDRFEPGYAKRNAILLDGSKYIETVETFLAPFVKDRPRVLDWGGDTGVNTPFRGKASVHHIYDISNRPVVAGAAPVQMSDVASNIYDLIVYSNVLEHVPDPRGSLSEIAAVMKPETVLYIEAPHEDVVRQNASPAERLKLKRHWHEHINFFSAEALDAAFRHTGLRAIERKTQQISAGGKDSHVFSIVAKRA